MTATITILSNDFHGTEYRTKKTREELEAMYGRAYQGTATDAEKAMLRRIRRALCGTEGCRCGNWLGER